MKRILLGIAFLLWIPMVNGSDATDEDVKKFFDVISVKRNYQAGIEGMMAVQRRTVKDFYLFESTFKEWVDKYISWESVEPDMIKLYRGHFSSEDIKELTRFYQTPVGKKYIENAPLISKETMKIGGDAAASNRKYLQEMMKVKIESLKLQGLYKGKE